MTATTPQESQLIVILDDDVMVTEALAAGLEREGRTVVTCNDLESAQLVVERLRPSHIVADVRLTGAFGFEGLEFIHYAKQHSPESRVVLITGDAPEALQLEASERGAVAFLQKPFEIAELDAIIDLLTCSVLSSSAGQTPVIRMPVLDEILTNGSLQMFFQPIVHLDRDYTVLGYEALARYEGNSLLRNPEFLFQYATRKQRVADLELACLATSLDAGSTLAQDRLLFMNVHPGVLSHRPGLAGFLLHAADHAGVSLGNVVLEITEQESLTPGRKLLDNIDELRGLGVRFAFDDLGVAYSHLPLIDRIRPSFLKISQYFGTSFEDDPTKLKIVINLQSLARDFGSDLILEGIEHAATAELAGHLGIKYGQGFFFGRPAEASALRW